MQIARSGANYGAVVTQKYTEQGNPAIIFQQSCLINSSMTVADWVGASGFTAFQFVTMQVPASVSDFSVANTLSIDETNITQMMDFDVSILSTN